MRILLGLMLLIPLVNHAQEEAQPAAAAPPKPCSTDKHRQFDFWLGQWAVSQNGQPAGNNHITLIHGGCVLAENWTSTGAFSGSSLNMYDQANDKWHQTWTDSSGTLLELDGGLVDGNMVLSGKRPGQNGGEVINRITWTPHEDGSVRQHWEVSADGENWSSAFDGLYVRAEVGE